MQETKGLICKKLSGAQCRDFRPLWEEAFGAEESPAFTELYFRERAPENRGYGLYLKDRLVSMLYLTPYPVNMRESAAGCPHTLYYIVGVATARDCRHRGYMTELLREALRDMRREGLPFTYLTPAAPAIYEPFGFRYIGRKPVWEFDGSCPAPGFGESGVPVSGGSEASGLCLQPGAGAKKTAGPWRRLGPVDFPGLAVLAERWLAGNGKIAVKRDAAYYAARAAELEAEGGGVYGWFPAASAGGCLSCLSVSEDAAVHGERPFGAALLMGNWRQEPEEGIVEAYAWERAEEFPFREKASRPSVMGRVLQPEALLALAGSSRAEGFSCRLWLQDSFLPENTGAYEWRVQEGAASGCRLPEVKKEDCQLCLTADALTELVFGCKEALPVLGALRPLSCVFLNEIV